MTYLTKFRKVTLQTEWTLPQTSVVIAHRVSLVQLVTLWPLVGKTTDPAQYQLAYAENKQICIFCSVFPKTGAPYFQRYTHIWLTSFHSQLPTVDKHAWLYID